MTVTVRCLAVLAAYAPAGGRMELPGAATVGDLADRLAMPREAVATALRNGGPADFDTPLADGDTVSFLPPITGG